MFSRTFASSVCALALSFALAGLAQAEIYKCTVDGEATFSDKPCPSGQKSQVLEDKKAQTVPAPKKIAPSAAPTPASASSASAAPGSPAPHAADKNAVAASPSTSPTPAHDERRCFKNKNGHTFCNANPNPNAAQ
jgi:hypothetical protein